MLSDPKGNPACQRLLKLNYELKKENQVLKEKVSKLSEKTTHTISQHEKTIIQDDYSPNFLSYETFSSDIIHSDRDQSEEKLESYLKKLPLPCQSIDEYGKLIYVNPAWLNTLGYSWREVIGQYFGHFLHPESLKSFENECFSTQDTHIFRNLQFYIRQKNGRYISASFGGYVEYHEDGSFLRANCYFQDITKFKQCIEAYKGLLNNSMLGLFILSGNYIKYANPQAGKISAYTLEELLALNHRQMLSIIDPEDRNKVIKAFQKLGRKEETSGELEFRIFNKESGIRWIHAYISLIRYMDKPSFQIAFIDITDQKNLTQKLVESEKRYHDMYRHTPAIMHSINHEYRLVEVSDFWLETMGYKREEVIGRPSVDFLTPKSREFAIKKALPNFRKKGYARNVPYQFVKKNGEIVDVLFSAIAEYDNEGNMHRTLAIANDITQQKKNEQQIIESEVKYRNLVENSPVGIIVFINDKIELVNNAFLKLSGYHSMEEVMHISYADLIHPDDRQKVMQELKRKKSSEQALSHYYRMIRKNGEVIDVTEHTSEFNFHNKIYKQCIFEDITQVINTEESKRIIQDKTAFLERKLQINKQAEAELLSIIQSENLEINKFLTLLNLLRNETEIEKHWKIFEDNFASLHPDFFNKLHSIAPKLTQQDLKHCAFIKMKLDTKQIATLFNVKPSSVQMSRVRLKKKLRLKRSEDLFYFINSL